MIIDSTTAAVVTGGASGLGQATAQALAAAGVKVAIFDVNEAKGEEVAKAIGGLFCKVDITSEDSVVAGFAKARAAHGQERVLVHCAMTSRRGKTLAFSKEEGKLKRLPTSDYDYGVQGILVASYRVASLSAEGMANTEALADGERGVIILTASVAAQDGQIGQVIYGSAKAGVNGLTRALAKEWGRYKVNVNSVAFGLIKTRLTEASADQDTHIDIEGQQIKVGVNPHILKSAEQTIPLGRGGTPDEAAGAVLLFCFPESNYISGQTLVCAGGKP